MWFRVNTASHSSYQHSSSTAKLCLILTTGLPNFPVSLSPGERKMLLVFITKPNKM